MCTYTCIDTYIDTHQADALVADFVEAGHNACVAGVLETDVAHINVVHLIHVARPCCRPRWQRLVGCLKLHVIFRKRATNYRALVRK